VLISVSYILQLKSRTLNRIGNTLIWVIKMNPVLLQSPLQNFAQMIGAYFIEIWGFLIFIGQMSGVVIVLIGAILWFTEANQKKGKGLVLSGVLLSIVIEYFVLFPPSFALS